MRKMIVIAAFAAAVFVTGSFGTGQIEVTVTPAYTQSRDQQRELQRREQIRIEQQKKYEWQVTQWKLEQRRRNVRHLELQSYDVWLVIHFNDYDDWRRDTIRWN
jgi:hypothetical protein